MDKLSFELLSIIEGHVRPGPDRIALACVSRRLQLATEHYTFRKIKLTSTYLEEAISLFRPDQAHRYSAVRKLEYEIILPKYSFNSCKRVESKRAKARNNEVFTEAVVGLFSLLSREVAVGARLYFFNGLRLSIFGVFSPSDTEFKELWSSSERPWQDLGHERYAHSYLRLLIGDSDEELGVALPKLLRITSLQVFGYPTRLVEAATVARIAGRMPNLQVLDLEGMSDDEYKFPAIRQQMRMDFGQMLLRNCRTGVFNNLASFTLYLESIQPYNHNMSVNSLHPSHPTTDFLSLGLNALSRLPSMKNLILTSHISLSPSIFWPKDLDSDGVLPCWPSLKILKVKFTTCTPSGGWYIKEDPFRTSEPNIPESIYNSDSDSSSGSFSERSASDSDLSTTGDWINHRKEEVLRGAQVDVFRTIIDPAAFNPVILALAKAVARMEKIQRVEFMFMGACLPPADFTALYVSEGIAQSMVPGDEANIDKKRLYLEVGQGLKWGVPEMDKELLWALKECVGEGGVVGINILTEHARNSADHYRYL